MGAVKEEGKEEGKEEMLEVEEGVKEEGKEAAVNRRDGVEVGISNADAAGAETTGLCGMRINVTFVVSGADGYVQVALVPQKKLKKRKICMFLAYNGKNYQGMQRNPGVVTIEEVMEQAIVAAGGVSDLNAGSFSKVSWSRSARTDKGVSALCQVISLKMMIPDDFLIKLNQALPSDILAYGFQRVTSGFCAKNECDRRTYEYVLPTAAFDPTAKRERQYYIDNNLDPEAMRPPKKFSTECQARVNEVLSRFTGTHAYQNYTVGMKPGDPKGQRYILEFFCGDPFEIDGMEFVALRVRGQSFILHQIRKMVGMTLAVVRGLASDTAHYASLRKDVVMSIPMAPAEGLYLLHCSFEYYNKKFGKTHETIDANIFSEQRDQFKWAKIYPHIAAVEKSNDVMGSWLKMNMNERRFSYEPETVVLSSFRRGDASGEKRKRPQVPGKGQGKKKHKT